jgi:hypothetical protein
VHLDDASLVIAGPSGARLRAAFAECDGRIVGSVFLEHDAQSVEVLREILAGGEAWPLSPPWQELHVHAAESGERALMLVGRAGTSHWSMTVSADDALRGIVFDVACRVRSQPDFLGSTYDALSPLASKIEFQPLSIGVSTALVEQHPASIIIRPRVSIQPPATVRWKYCVRFVD